MPEVILNGEPFKSWKSWLLFLNWAKWSGSPKSAGTPNVRLMSCIQIQGLHPSRDVVCDVVCVFLGCILQKSNRTHCQMGQSGLQITSYLLQQLIPLLPLSHEALLLSPNWDTPTLPLYKESWDILGCKGYMWCILHNSANEGSISRPFLKEPFF